MLLDPRDTREASLRLESLGRDLIPVLKTGLESEHPFVRFCSAEALAYLGSTAGVEDARPTSAAASVVRQELHHRACQSQRDDLPRQTCRNARQRSAGIARRRLPCSVRYDERDQRLQGFHLNETFWLHQISQAPTQMVYFSTGKRPQIVMLGKNIRLEPGTRVIIPKDFTVAFDDKTGKFLVKRITTPRRSAARELRQRRGDFEPPFVARRHVSGSSRLPPPCAGVPQYQLPSRRMVHARRAAGSAAGSGPGDEEWFMTLDF